MPGKESYGPCGKWIHDRAHQIMRKTREKYGEERGKQIAYAIATQQAHGAGKAPKNYGTPKSKKIAEDKYDGKLKKTASNVPHVILAG